MSTFFNSGGLEPWGTTIPLWGMAGIAFTFTLLILWSVVWKGLALWHAARRGESWWFIALLIINTAGILEIIYLFVIAKIKFSDLFKK